MRPILQSVYMSQLWQEATLTADIVPTDMAGGAGSHGIHAVLPEYASSYLLNLSPSAHWNGVTEKTIRALGAVDCYGTIQVHEDKVVRAEHTRILALNVVVTPGFSCCSCGALTVVDDRSSDTYKLRYACSEDGCSERPLRPAYKPVARTSVNEIAGRLRGYYEVGPLPPAEGPWYRRRG